MQPRVGFRLSNLVYNGSMKGLERCQLGFLKQAYIWPFPLKKMVEGPECQLILYKHLCNRLGVGANYRQCLITIRSFRSKTMKQKWFIYKRDHYYKSVDIPCYCGSNLCSSLAPIYSNLVNEINQFQYVLFNQKPRDLGDQVPLSHAYVKLPTLGLGPFDVSIVPWCFWPGMVGSRD